MKAGNEHRIPLSARALEIVQEMKAIRQSDYMFPGQRPKSPLSNAAFLALLKRMGVPVTVHGFRSCFRDWTAEQTGYPNHVAEQALAHTIPSAVERAYRRGDLFEKRARLMADWSEYIDTPALSD